MAKLGRILLIVLLVLLALVIAAAVAVETRWARGLMEDQLSQRMEGRAVNIGDLEIDWGFPLGIQASDVQIANADWAEHEQLLSVDALDVTLKVGPLFRGQVALGTVDLQQPTVHLARREDGTTNWDALTPDEEKEDKEPPVQPDIIRIRDGTFTYRDEALDADIAVTVQTEESEEQRQLQVTGRGEFQGETFQLDAQGGAPSEALEQGSRYPVTIDASLGDMRLGFEGESLNIYRLEALHGDIEFTAPDQAQLTKLTNLLDQPGLTVPPVDLQAELNHQDERWALENIQANAGSSDLSGSAAVRLTDTPQFDVQLDSEQINLNEFGVAEMLAEKRDPANRERGAKVGVEQSTEEKQQEQEQEQGGEEPSWDQRMSDMLAPLRDYAGNADVQVGELILGEARLSDLALQGSLESGRLQIDQLNAAQDSGGLGASGWIEAQEDTIRADLTANLDHLNLGQALQPFGMEQLGIVDGQLHGAFDGDALRISDTQLSHDKPEQELHIQAQIMSREVPDTEAPGLHVEGQGTRQGEGFEFNLTMGPLLDLKAEDQPYPVEGTLTSGETRATIDGSITQPLELKAFDIRFDIAGPNPAELNPVTGLSLPDLQQYQASGRMQLQNQLLRVTDLRATIGKSDLSGDVRVDFDGRTMLWATLHSNQINTNDLIKVAEAADTADQQDPEQFKSPGEVFDHEPLDFQVLGQIDAEIRYRADNIIAKDIPMNDVVLDASLDEGVLQVKPLRVGLGGGDVSVDGELNAREPALQGDLSLSIKQVNLTPLLESADLPQLAKDSAGVLGGKGNLRFSGESVAELMAGLDGVIELAMSGGYLDALAVEVVGLDAGEALVSAVSDDQRVPLRCTYVKADAEDGLVTMENFYINTADTNIIGGGTINLATEQLDLVIKPNAKDFSVLSADTPVELNGSLGDPKVSVLTGSLVAKGIASVVGALVAPPLAILPWIETGTGEGTGPGCRQALQEFQQPQEQ
ncbi:Uncharacterized protein involved in outer membrane biogenesis [Halopseudomonas xinjiangensis]|uniref:Uncharacterized protein involved in outer membrane biogenesis n=1 Tax=Halopseudomonas xinjiangensis TaxID=487184 RepID=A0A1H1QJQ6_9GAMM|nr:AsmA family protein [Halopseudomonas xinjiangensis]SDS23690.1 Uncharacterized protein involved in outer membrane biogenesis [Halopseudomonas xinjiangensis]